MRKIFSGRSAGDFRGDVSEAGRPACGSTRWPPGVWRRIGGRKARHAEDLIFAERVADSLFRSSERSHRRASCARLARVLRVVVPLESRLDCGRACRRRLDKARGARQRAAQARARGKIFAPVGGRASAAPRRGIENFLFALAATGMFDILWEAHTVGANLQLLKLAIRQI